MEACGLAPPYCIMEHNKSAWSNLRGLTSLSLCDWPGRSACVLFLGGCGLHCPTCHNAGLAWNPERYPVLFTPDVLRFLSSRAGWLDGIVVSGGEPTSDPNLLPLLADLKRLGLPVKVDTNGMQPDVLAAILKHGLAQAFSVDIKGPFDKYPQLTGGAVSQATATARLTAILDLAAHHPEAFLFRLTKVPLLDDADVDIARSYLPHGFTLAIQTYIEPRRTHAAADSQERWTTGDLVHPTHRRSHPQGPQGQRHQGPDPVPEAGLQG